VDRDFLAPLDAQSLLDAHACRGHLVLVGRAVADQIDVLCLEARLLEGPLSRLDRHAHVVVGHLASDRVEGIVHDLDVEELCHDRSCPLEPLAHPAWRHGQLAEDSLGLFEGNGLAGQVGARSDDVDPRGAVGGLGHQGWPSGAEKMQTPLCPPKAKELDMTWRSFARRERSGT